MEDWKNRYMDLQDKYSAALERIEKLQTQIMELRQASYPMEEEREAHKDRETGN